jgi:hypothetical protein
MYLVLVIQLSAEVLTKAAEILLTVREIIITKTTSINIIILTIIKAILSLRVALEVSLTKAETLDAIMKEIAVSTKIGILLLTDSNKTIFTGDLLMIETGT